MASILAIVSKKVFEKDFAAGIGDVVATSFYASTHVSLEKLKAGGDLFLVTVAPGEQLWLAGVLAAPKFAKDRWTASANTTPITDITALIPKLAFENGKGLTAKAGALGMSLQTPRTLADSDVELLRGATGDSPAKSAKAVKAEPAAAKSAKAPPRAKPVLARDDDRSSAVSAAGDLGLAKVSADINAGAYAAALDGLLSAWERCKAVELADLIDELGTWAAGALPAITGNKKTIDAAFSDVADLVRPVDMPRLIKALELGSSPQVANWLDILERFPLDPRLCPAAIVYCTKFVASSAGPSRTRAFRMAEKIADGRCLPQIQKLLKSDKNAWNWKDLKDRIRKMAASFAPPPALPEAEKATVAALGTAVAKLVKQPSPDEATLFRSSAKTTKSGSGDALLAEVLANPDDDAARLVYADYLQQQNDPRGELIALQMQPVLTPAQRDRVDKLVKNKANIRRWLGPLAAVVSDPVFERGFLHACGITLKTNKHRELLAHPLFSTVQDVRCDEVVVVEHLRSLRRLEGAKIKDLVALAAGKPVNLEELAGVELYGYDDDLDDVENQLPLWEQFCKIGACTKLRRLGLEADYQTGERRGIGLAAFAWLFDSKLGKQLEHVAIDFDEQTPVIAPWLPIFNTHAKLSRLELRCEEAHYQMLPTTFATIATRTDDKLAIKLELARIFDKGEILKSDISKVPELLVGLPTKATSRDLLVEVTSQVTQKQLDFLRTHLETALGKQFASVTVQG